MADYTLNPKYSSIDQVVERYQTPEGLQVDLGCGFSKPAGFIGVDNLIGSSIQVRDEENAPDILMDIDRSPLPFEEDSCTRVRASHFLEHSSNLDHVFGEIHRVLRKNGIFFFAVPYANSAEGMYPGHQVFFTEKWFHENIIFQRYFRIVSEKYLPSSYFKRSPLRLLIPFRTARIFLFNACQEMRIEAMVKK